MLEHEWRQRYQPHAQLPWHQRWCGLGTALQRGRRHQHQHPTDTLTVSGPDDYDDGPTLHFAGEVADQVESGRIRSVETATSNTARGGYIRFDGQSNRLALGGHAATSNLAVDDTDHLVILRDAPSRVGIGMVPSEALDVSGDIRTSGRIKFSERSVHEITLPGRRLQRDQGQQLSCQYQWHSQERQLRGGHLCRLSLGANHRQREHRRAADHCQQYRHANLSREAVLRSGPFAADLRAGQRECSNQCGESEQSNHHHSRRATATGSAVLVRVEVASTECTIAKVRVRYTLPGGFIP